MPSPITKEKAQAIAQSLVNCGWNKSKALIALGYDPQYANCGMRKATYNNILVKQEIKAIQEKLADKCEITAEGQIKKTEEHRLLALEAGHITAANAPLDMQNRSVGLYNADTSGGLSIVDIMAVVGINAEEPLDAHTGPVVDEQP